VTLTRGLTGDNSLETWINDAQFGKISNARKGSAIIVFDVEGTAVKRYNLINARLKTLERGSLKAEFLMVLPGRDRVLARQIERSRR
jgi:phage tail-like protein